MTSTVLNALRRFRALHDMVWLGAGRRGLPPLKITGVKVILTQPGPDHLVVVKVLTSEPGLYGVGCATHRERPQAVAAYIDHHLKPFVIGKNCDDIEDIWQSAYVASYSARV